MAGFVIAYFAVLKPTPFKIAEDLKLNSSERAKIENPNEVIA